MQVLLILKKFSMKLNIKWMYTIMRPPNIELKVKALIRVWIIKRTPEKKKRELYPYLNYCWILKKFNNKDSPRLLHYYGSFHIVALHFCIAYALCFLKWNSIDPSKWGLLLVRHFLQFPKCFSIIHLFSLREVPWLIILSI